MMTDTKKKAATRLPNDGYSMTETDGLNYGLDGFFHEMDYGAGVEQGGRLPEVEGLSGLPGTVACGEQDLPSDLIEGQGMFEVDDRQDDMFSFDPTALTAFLEEGRPAREAGLSNLQWLEQPIGTDPDRLPNPSPHDSVAELERAWGTTTDGVSTLVPNKDMYREVDASLARLPNETFEVKRIQTVKKAYRASAMGQDLRGIFEMVRGELGDRSFEVRDQMSRLASEHGLAGQVFVRSSAYPGLVNLKWGSFFKKKFPNVRYIVADDRKTASLDRLHGKKIVAEVPWKEAWNHYRPLLTAAGHKTASTGDPRQDLLRALSAKPVRQKVRTEFPTHVVASDRVTTADALTAMKAAPKDRKVFQRSAREETRLRRTVLAKIESLVSSQRLTRDQADSVWGGTAREALRKVAGYLRENNKAKTASYTGPEAHYHNTNPETRKWAKIQKGMSKVSAEQIRVASKLRKWMSEGLAGNDLDSTLKLRFASSVLNRNSVMIDSLRKTHEGLSGHAYVDASAYASKIGTVGCDAGALRHRANAIKHVFAMRRCNTCVFNSRGTCQKYNKRLASEVPVANPSSYQIDIIRLANMDDAERTAAIFAPTYDPNEYQLHNASLDHVSMDDMPDNDTLGEVLWGGFMIGD